MNGSDFNWAVKVLEDGENVMVKCGIHEYEVGPASKHVGREENEGYVSEVLGDEVYLDAETILDSTISYLEQEGQEIILIT